MDILKGDVVYVDLEPVRGSETGKMRPCLIIQNNTNNEYSSTTIIIVITSRNILKKKYPTHVWIDKGEGGLTKDSVIQCEQIRTIDKRRITPFNVYNRISRAGITYQVPCIKRVRNQTV